MCRDWSLTHRSDSHFQELNMTRALTTIITLLALASPIEAQDSSPTPPSPTGARPDSLAPYRSPAKAALLGKFFPGAGQVYSGERMRGYGYYVGFVGGVGMGTMMLVLGNCTLNFLSECRGPSWPHYAVGALAIGAGIASWISAFRDAPHAAERANERHRRSMQVRPALTVVPDESRSVRVGLAAKW
jgi:hypothetical protein